MSPEAERCRERVREYERWRNRRTFIDSGQEGKTMGRTWRTFAELIDHALGERYGLSETAGLLWLVLLRWTKPGSGVRIRHKRLARMIGRSARTTTRAKRELRQAGLLFTAKRGGRYRPTTFHVWTG